MVDPKTLEPNEVIISLKFDPDREVPGYSGSMICSLTISEEGDEDSLALALDEAVTLLAYHEIGEYEDIDLYKAQVLQRLFPDEYADAETRLDERQVEVSKNGNVYTLSFDSETKGSA